MACAAFFIVQSDIDFRQIMTEISALFQQQEREQAAQLQLEIAGLIKRLDETKNTLALNISSAEEKLNGLTDKKVRWLAKVEFTRHQEIFELAQGTIFNNPALIELQQKNEHANSLVQTKHYRDSLPALKEVKQTYTDFLANLDMLEPMHLAQQDAKKNQADWHAFKRKYVLDLGPVEIEPTVDAQMSQADTARDAGDYILAQPNYTQAAQGYLAMLNGPEAEAAIEAARRRVILARLMKEMVKLPGGQFRMGDISGNGEDDEKPVHEVLIPAFAMKKTEVTFEQYDIFAKDTKRPFPDDSGWGRGKRPVINVSWHDVIDYIEWINKKTGKTFRLPTEAEWEYAARSGSEAKYSWGDTPSAQHANGGEEHGWPKDGFYKQTAPVASFKPNQFGLYDMHGNVLEWTQDCWKFNYVLSPASSRAWLKGDCKKRVRRGGSWVNPPSELRSSKRYWSTASTRSSIGGFRLAQDLP